MNARTISACTLAAILAVAATAATLAAQQPVPGITLHLQLISADTAVKTRDSAFTTMDKMYGGYVQCLPPEPGQRRRVDPACGPNLRTATRTLLADQSATTDAQGHVMQRLSSPSGEAAVEVDVTDYTATRSGDGVHLKVAFWPALAAGEPALPTAAIRASMLIPLGHMLNMTIMTPRGATILTLRPELAGARPPAAARRD